MMMSSKILWVSKKGLFVDGIVQKKPRTLGELATPTSMTQALPKPSY